MDEATFRELVSGKRRGLVAGLKRGGLWCASLVYMNVVRLRNLLFDIGIRRSHRINAFVVSVGNLTTGGTGKTPIVGYFVQWLSDHQQNVVILSRGFRSLDGEANDEKLVLERLCPGIVHLQQPDRVAAARIACVEHEANAIVLDDGFQHRRLARDLNLVLIDMTNPWGYGHILPRGLLREPRSELRRADAFLLTRIDQATQTERDRVREWLQTRYPDAPIAEVAFGPIELVDWQGQTRAISDIEYRRVFAFCGIGNPFGFERTLARQSCEVVGFQSFADHHHYTRDDFEAVEREAGIGGAELLVTTEKDIVKLARGRIGRFPVWALRIGPRFHSGERELVSLLEHAIEARNHSARHRPTSK